MYRILLALSEDSPWESWVRLCVRLLPNGMPCDGANAQGEIVLRGLVEVPETKSLSEGALPARQLRDALTKLAGDDPLIHDEVRVHVDYRPAARLIEELPSLNVELVVLQWRGPAERTGGLTTDELLRQIPCDVALLTSVPGDSGPVLLSLRGGPNISLGVRLAKSISCDSYITLFHAADQSRAAPDLDRIMRADPQIRRTVTAVSGIQDGILREARGHHAIVLGATFHHLQPSESAASPLLHTLHQATSTPLVLVRAAHPEELRFHAPYLPRVEEEALSTRVDRWFAENTFDSAEFADLSALLALKERRGVTISVGLPALNEEETVGLVIDTLKRTLMDEVPLVDEIVLIDSNSTDNTVAIAEARGIPVYRHPEILPEIGSYRGKGEALWKSLHVLKGDIVAWVDTDITNIHPRFIYGLLGPLLKHPRVQYVKGFYQRPIQVGDKIQAYGGGRVTELVARPLFNLFYPELSGIIQPLSGEYAGRRAALENVPFFSGYGVETGLLIDLLDRYGLDAIAQTDLEVRVHHNQPLVGLSKMSFAILQVFIARLEGRYRVELLDKANRSMKLIVQEPERFALDIAEITDTERPPMMNVPGYVRERAGSIAAGS